MGINLKAFFGHIGHLFSNDNLTAVEHFVAIASPVVAEDLVEFMGTLEPAFASLEKAAAKAIELYHDAKGVTLSKSLAIAVAQNVFSAKSADIVAEAEALIVHS